MVNQRCFFTVFLDSVIFTVTIMKNIFDYWVTGGFHQYFETFLIEYKKSESAEISLSKYGSITLSNFFSHNQGQFIWRGMLIRAGKYELWGWLSG